jgi:hypothetical protein
LKSRSCSHRYNDEDVDVSQTLPSRTLPIRQFSLLSAKKATSLPEPSQNPSANCGEA